MDFPYFLFIWGSGILLAMAMLAVLKLFGI